MFIIRKNRRSLLFSSTSSHSGKNNNCSKEVLWRLSALFACWTLLFYAEECWGQEQIIAFLPMVNHSCRFSYAIPDKRFLFPIYIYNPLLLTCIIVIIMTFHLHNFHHNDLFWPIEFTYPCYTWDMFDSWNWKITIMIILMVLSWMDILLPLLCLVWIGNQNKRKLNKFILKWGEIGGKNFIVTQIKKYDN